MPPHLFLTLFLVCLLTGQSDLVRAGTTPGSEARTPHVAVALLSEQATVAPGSVIWVGLRFRLEPGWHVYGRNPGDSGYQPPHHLGSPGGRDGR